MNRTITGFFIAPIWAPILTAPYAYFFLFPDPRYLSGVAFATMLSAASSYLAVGLIGLPVLKYSKSRLWASVWVAVVTGAAIGIATYLVLISAIFALGWGVEGLTALLLSSPRLAINLWAPGVIGAAVGITLWLIARPDRDARRR